MALLDVNLPIVLFDPIHVHHEVGHAWFAINASHGWAACALTENAVVRILASPSYPGRRPRPGDAAARLRQFRRSRDHGYSPDSLSILEPMRSRLNHVQGHRQITGRSPMSTCWGSPSLRRGRLATLDARTPLRSVVRARASNVVIVDA